MLNIKREKIDGVLTIDFIRFIDNRGSFMEAYRKSGNPLDQKYFFDPVQINVSTSRKNVIRGMHYSLALEKQDKLIFVANGKILDTVLDIRTESPTFGEHVQVEISSDNDKAVLIKSGLAHGFSVLSDSATVIYFMSSQYQPEFEFDINPFDPDLNINWKVSSPITSEKDLGAPTLLAALKDGRLPHYRNGHRQG